MRQGVESIILAVAPLCEEVIRLREENNRLRFEKHPELPGLRDLLKGTPIELYQTPATGAWHFRFPHGKSQTGGESFGTMIDAFQAAINHIFSCWNATLADLDEAYSDE